MASNENIVPNTDGSLEEFSDTKSQEPVVNAQNESAKEPDYQKMFKDTQAAYTKARQEVAALKAKNAALEKAIVDKGVQLDPAVAEELERLKYEDPEAWRQKLNAIENAKAKEVTSEITRQAEVARRKEVLASWNQENQDAQITDYIVNNVLPAGLTNKLKKGEVSFEGFLAEASNFLRQTKVGPGNSQNAGKKDPMSIANGTANISQTTQETDYSKMIF
ncbi:hypothetical protein [Methanobrevibacter sp.]|uniref:hypothetical protein n=1 Tax=Methanobrevibacter sp. TaxID=66852 RepID=UPI003D7CA9DB